MKFNIKQNKFNFKTKYATIKEYPELENIEITPNKEEQNYKSENYYGYDEVKVNGVTNEIDTNIKPENIKEGVDILGVSGNVEELNGEELTITKNGEYIPTEPINAYTKVIADVPVGEGDPELAASYLSSIDDTLGQNTTKLPNGITTIGNYAFYSKKNLALTELPNTLTTIGNSAFRDCQKMPLAKLSDNLTSIGTYCFYQCRAMTITEVPSGITALPNYAFYNCATLTELTIKGNITSIGNTVFNACSLLAKIVLPNVTSVPTLGSSVFTSTQIAKGNGYIYVPDSLVDSFKSATNWSTYADQIKGVSEL